MNLGIVKQINDSPYKAFIAIVGGGQSFIGDYLKISGASKTIVGAIVPYDRHVFDKFVGQKMTEYSSVFAARKLALASFQQCLDAEVEKTYAIGIGAASSIASDGERVGRIHKINIAIHTIFYTKTYKITLTQGRTREMEDNYISEVILTCLAHATRNMTVEFPQIQGNNTDEDTFTQEEYVNENLQSIVSGKSDMYCTIPVVNKDKIAIFGGSFNILHDGHIAIKKTAEKILNQQVLFELSVKNADKGYIDFADINLRLNYLCKYDYILTCHPTIKEKIDLLKKYNPESEITIIVGADTWNRVWDKRYGYDLNELHDFFINSKVKFLVFGRNSILLNREFNDLIIPSIEAENFNMAISSSELRKLKSEPRGTAAAFERKEENV